MSLKKLQPIVLILSILLSACSAPARQTAPAIALIVPSATAAAAFSPSAPAASTSTTTPAPTETARPSSTPRATASPLPRITLTAPPSLTPIPVPYITPGPTSPVIQAANPTLAFFEGANVTGNVAGLGTARLLIINETGSKEIFIILKGTTLRRSQPAYYAYTVANSLVIEILWGSYNVLIQVPGRQSLTAAFVQRGKDKTTFEVERDRLLIIGP